MRAAAHGGGMLRMLSAATRDDPKAVNTNPAGIAANRPEMAPARNGR
jgi:hypothetical protein